jgi:hypothetical protein
MSNLLTSSVQVPERSVSLHTVWNSQSPTFRGCYSCTKRSRHLIFSSDFHIRGITPYSNFKPQCTPTTVGRAAEGWPHSSVLSVKNFYHLSPSLSGLKNLSPHRSDLLVVTPCAVPRSYVHQVITLSKQQSFAAVTWGQVSHPSALLPTYCSPPAVSSQLTAKDSQFFLKYITVTSTGITPDSYYGRLLRRSGQ